MKARSRSTAANPKTTKGRGMMARRKMICAVNGRKNVGMVVFSDVGSTILTGGGI
jgi:hypothetical protein